MINITKEPLTCVILSGGKSSRMGEDKSLLAFDQNYTMIEYLTHKLSKIFTNLYISTKIDKFQSQNLPNVKLILDENSQIYSPLIALQTILQQIDTQKVFITTVDMPLLEEKTIQTLIERSSGYAITIAKDTQNNTHNLCGVFSKELLGFIEELLAQDIHKVNRMIKESNSFQEILFDNPTQFLNINTPSEYKKLQKRDVLNTKIQ